MNAFSSVVEYVDDRINPIVVKELRQAVQSQFILTVLTLFLILQSVVLGISLCSGEAESMTRGRDVFLFLHGVVVFVCFLIIPMYACIRLGNERSETNVDLLFISSISPSSIVWGKFCSSMVLVLLIYSACLPYMTVTFLLRGIDLPSIAVVLALDLIVITASVQAAILVGSFPLNKGLKALLTLAFIGGSLGGFGTMTGLGVYMVRQGVGSLMGNIEFWATGGMIVIGVVAFCGFVGALSVSGIMPAAANRSFYPRLLFTIGWLVTGLCAIVFDKVAISSGSDSVVYVWAIGMTAILADAYLIAICERDESGDRLRRSASGPWHRRAFMFFFSSGAGAGVLWTSALLIGTIALMWLDQNVIDPERALRIVNFRPTFGMCLFAAYAFCYAMTPTLLRWYFYRRIFKTSTNAAAALILVTLGMILPLLIYYFIYGPVDRYSHETDLIFLGNPFYLCSEMNSISEATFNAVEIFLTAWISIILLAGTPWLVAQYRSFRPIDLPPPPSDPTPPNSFATRPEAPPPSEPGAAGIPTREPY